MEGDAQPVNASGREYRKKRVEELGSALAQIRARVKSTRGSGSKKDEEVEQSGGSKVNEGTERTALTKKKLEEDRVRFNKLQQNRVKMKEEYNQILIEREEQKKVEKQLQETIAKVTAPTPELPPLIKQRIIDLETNVENLKERLSEKDKVLSSKTQALTVLHNQLMQRSQEQVEKAMAFTQEISTIKEDFSKREEHLKKEINRLKEREEELELRLSDKELHSNELVSLQAELDEVKKELNEAVNKNEDSAKALESTNKINLKLKAQLKAMKLERDKLKKAQESIEDTEELKNRIALLEEEKGNLQLQLVDYDEFKESYSKIEDRAKLFEDELAEMRKNFTLLEEEKSSLQSSLESANSHIEEQNNLIESLRSSLKEIEEHKISAEMRAIEIEEKMEGLQNKISSQIDQFHSEIQGLQSQINEKNTIIESLSNQLSLKEQEIFDIKGNNFPAEVETDSRLREIESYNSELVEKVRELQLKSEGYEKAVVHLNESLAEKNETINNLKTKCDEFKAVVDDLNNNKIVLENKIEQLKADAEGQKQEHQPKEASSSKEDINLKFKKLAANYKIKVKLCQELEEKLNAANSLVEKSAALLNAAQTNKAFEELKEWKENDSKLLKEHVSNVNSMANNVSRLEQELGSLQSILNEKNCVIGELETERNKLVEDMRNSELELDRLRGLYEKESVRNQNVLTNLQGIESEMLVSREEMNQIAEQLESVTKNYNICLGSLQERENYIEALEQDIVGMKTRMYNLESGIGDRHRSLEERGNQLSARLEEAEILTKTFGKYQAEMDKKFKLMEDNEIAMKSNIEQLQVEINMLNKLNQELKIKNVSSEKEVAEMSQEIDSLKEVKNAYNVTLDQIEILNNDLKQVMEDFESKNQELIKLAEERADLFNKLTDLEDAYSDLRSQLDESEENTLKLQSELTVKTNALENSLLEIKSLTADLDELKANNSDVKTTVDVPTEEVKVFSWDQFGQAPAKSSPSISLFDDESVKLELEEKRKELACAQQEIYSLQLQIASGLSQKDAEILSLNEKLTAVQKEYDEIRTISHTRSAENNSLSSFDSESVKFELEEKNKELALAQQEIYNLKLQISSEISQKDAEISSLKEEIGALQNQIQPISRARPAESSASFFSWDDHQSGHHTDDAVYQLEEYKNKLNLAEDEINRLKSQQDSSRGNSGEVQMFSWGDHNVDEDADRLKLILKEKTESLKTAQVEISNLQAALHTLLNEKNAEVSALREEVNTLLARRENLERVNAERGDVEENRPENWGQQNLETGKDEEDGWGWIGAEANLEQDHKHSEALQIQTLTQRVSALEEEKNTLNDKLNASKIKCLKLVKKLKEIEALQMQSKTERNVGFSDLDFALQEELRSQLDQLEAKNKELIAELNSLKLEKDNLTKKTDVLISANEQLIEMKERQDIEVQMWQKRSAELKSEVQGLQWSLEELKSEGGNTLNKEDGDLVDKLNALAAENENLQGIIFNLKDGRPLGSPDTVSELNLVKEELSKLKELRIKEKESFENELRKANEELDSVEQQYDLLCKENKTLNEQLNELTFYEKEVSRLKEQLRALSEHNREKPSADTSDIESRVVALSNENLALKNQLSVLGDAGSELNSLKQHTEKLSNENFELKTEISSLQNVREESSSLLDKIQVLGIENAELKEKLSLAQEDNNYDLLQQKFDYVSTELNILKNDYQKVSSVNQQLIEELSLVKESSKELLEKKESDLKNLDNSLKSVVNEIRELDSLIEEMCAKFNLSVLPSSRIDTLKQVLVSVEDLLSKTSQFQSEITNLKGQLSPGTVEPPSIQFGSTPPVFKGFSSSSNDPFDSIQSNQSSFEVDTLRREAEQLRSIVNTYELEVSRLNSEKLTDDQIISDLKTELSALNEHIAKLSQQRSNKSDDVRHKLERADAEIAHWREEANNLRREINNLIEKHTQELEELRRNDAGSKEKLSEIEENFQNTMLNKDQESGYLKQILYEKEQLLANAINERNALQTQFESASQQIFSLENRVRDLIHENEELQGVLNQSRREENTVIEKQKEEIQELMAKLEQLSQSQNIRNAESENERHLKQQVKEMFDKLSLFEKSNSDMQLRLNSQTDEMSRLQQYIRDLNTQKIHLEGVINEKQREIDSLTSMKTQLQTSSPIGEDNTPEKLAALIKEKDLEISRVSKVLLDTQERLVQVQDSKPNDKVLSLQTKLDQALYTVHVRDVRIDELNLEIMQLLEERDSLQLRLSDSLRENELLRKGVMESSPTSSPEMREKLGELRTGYKKDPSIQQDMESRHNEQMDLYAEKENNTSVDYGIFNWFFSTPSSQPES